MRMEEDKRKLIKEAATKYYEEGEVILTDDQFDSLIEEVEDVKDVVGFGYEPSDKDRKVEHRFFIGSLDKVKVEVESDQKFSGVITPKLDGISCVIYVEDDKLMALTRGNGRVGIDVTNKIIRIIRDSLGIDVDEFVMKIKDAFSPFTSGVIGIRGELVIPNKFKDEIDAPSLRNYCAGIINRKSEDDDLRYVRFVPYSLLPEKEFDSQKLEILKRFRDIFTNTWCPWCVAEDMSSKELFELFTSDEFNEYPIDGLVVGNSFALKFPSDTADVIVERVRWNVGGTGRLIPIVEFYPVLLSGARIRKASGHNYKFVKENGIGRGSMITITRSGEIIPYIVSVSTKSDEIGILSNCPHCGSELVRKGVDIVCENVRCYNREVGRFFMLAMMSGIPDGIGGTTIRKLLEIINFRKIEDCYRLFDPTVGELCRRSFGMSYFEKVMKFIEDLRIFVTQRGLAVSEFYLMCNLEGLGLANSKKLPHPDKVKSKTDIDKFPVNSNVKRVLLTHYGFWKDLATKFKVNDVTEFESKKPIKFRIAITGKTSFKSRKKFIEFVEKYGVSVEGVTSKTDYLICNSGYSDSSKFKKAKELGIPIITEDEFIKGILKVENE